jgi:hypothetical protein
MRHAELAGVQFRDFDAQRGVLRVFGKGQKERLIPLRGPILAELRLALTADLPYLDRPPAGDDYLLYPIKRFADGKGAEGHGTPARRRIDAASDALGHSDLNTTLGIYGHFDETDLEGAMQAYTDWISQQDQIVPSEDRDESAKVGPSPASRQVRTDRRLQGAGRGVKPVHAHRQVSSAVQLQIILATEKDLACQGWRSRQ